jgi:hypothetical protein
MEFQNLPVSSVRMAQLFYEFLEIYNEWKTAKFQGMLWMLILLFLGSCILFFPWFLPGEGFILDIILLVLFYFAICHYLEINVKVNHLYVNVRVLHHHLVGKLEVGFCNHSDTCRCVENFRRYVIKRYNISLDNESLR